ncbi:MAG: sugar kinase [Bacteroidetes bacterium]|nr:sugar kinase [Bacteroidota bacterium]
MSLLCVGSVAFDAIETPFGHTERIVGGAGSYISLAASYFTQEVQLVSVVGDDFPTTFIELLNSKGVDTQGLQVIQGQKSFFWKGRYHNDLNTRDTLVTELNVLADFDPRLPASYQRPDFLMLGNLAPAVQMKVIRQIPVRPRLVALDTMNFWMDTAMEELNEVIAKVDVLMINDEEARQFTRQHSLVKAARTILAQGLRYLVIKKGEHGALLFHGNEVFFAPALPLEDVFDPTGAGDSFAGGFMGYLASTRDIGFNNLKRAVIYGSAMASFCVERFGTERLAHIARQELDLRIRAFVELVSFDIALV